MEQIIVRIAICFTFYIMGAYATTDILRLLKGSTVSVTAPDCYCPICNNKIALTDQLPIISYIRNCGKCRHCKSTIPFFDLFLEIFLFVLLSAVSILLNFSWLAYGLCVFIYELTKLVLLITHGKRENDFEKNLLRSLGNNVLLFLLIGFLFLLVAVG